MEPSPRNHSRYCRFPACTCAFACSSVTAERGLSELAGLVGDSLRKAGKVFMESSISVKAPPSKLLPAISPQPDATTGGEIKSAPAAFGAFPFEDGGYPTFPERKTALRELAEVAKRVEGGVPPGRHSSIFHQSAIHFRTRLHHRDRPAEALQPALLNH